MEKARPGSPLVLLFITSLYLISGSAVAETGDPSRQAAIAARGAQVMPFNLDETRHVFEATTTGGIQRVIANDAKNHTQIKLIQEHLQKEAARFQAGNFDDSAIIHGEDMPGLSQLRQLHKEISVRYQPSPEGATILYQSKNPLAISAIHQWFSAQITDHGKHAQH